MSGGLPFTVQVCPDNDGVTAELKKVLVPVLKDSVSRRVVIGLSGGSLPKFFVAAIKQVLAEEGVNYSWDRVKFIFCDERLVPFDNDDSTFGVFDNLLLKDPQV